MPVIDVWTLHYSGPTGEREVLSVYAYPSGGMGVSASDTDLVNALGGTRTLIDGLNPGESEQVAQRLADVFAYLLDCTPEYCQLSDDYEVEIP